MSTRALGQAGEDLACAFLIRQGWRVVDRNVRTREGEIDLIAARDDVLAFVEVKTRRSRAFGPPAEAVTYRKAARIRRLAAAWLAHNDAGARTVRFDVIDVLGRGDTFRVRHLEGAF